MLLHSFIKEPVVTLIMVFAPKGNKVRKTREKRLGINVRYMFLMSNKATIQERSKEFTLNVNVNLKFNVK